MKDAPEGVLYSPPRGAIGTDGPPQVAALSETGYRPVQDILAKYNPGVEGQEFATGAAAKFIAAGSTSSSRCTTPRPASPRPIDPLSGSFSPTARRRSAT